MGCNRYKLVCALYLGSLQGQGIAVTSRGLLDERFDSCDTVCYLSPSLYVVAWPPCMAYFLSSFRLLLYLIITPCLLFCQFRLHSATTATLGTMHFFNQSYGQFFSYYKKRQNSTFLAFAKILSIGLILSLSKNNYFYVLNKS